MLIFSSITRYVIALGVRCPETAARSMIQNRDEEELNSNNLVAVLPPNAYVIS